MYCNFSIYPSFLQPQDLFFLCGIKQVNTEINIPEDTLQRFSDNNLVTWIKGKAKEEQRLKIRLSEAGKKLMENLETPETEEEDRVIFDWLKKYYLERDKDIGNGAKTLRHIRDFRVKSGVSKNNLIKLVLDFLAENEDKSRKLEYIFYFPKTAFATRFDLEESWLWNHFIRNRERLEKTFEEY